MFDIQAVYYQIIDMHAVIIGAILVPTSSGLVFLWETKDKRERKYITAESATLNAMQW